MRFVPLARFRGKVAESAACDPQVQAYARHCLEQMPRGDLPATCKAISLPNHEDISYQLPCPALMIAGEQDAVGNGRVRQAALDRAKREPLAEPARIPAAGHITNMDAPDTVTQHILSFLNQAG